jgi:hypothetical protein
MNNALLQTTQTLRSVIQKAFFLLLCLVAYLHLGAAEKEPVSVANDLIKEMGSAWKLEYHENFSGCGIGEEPESLFILDGHYSVQEESKGQKYLQLPGTPMGDFGLLFGPRIKDRGLALRFSFFATKKGRRMPSIAAGIGGVRSLRLRLNPAARSLVISHDETILKQVPFVWKDGIWWDVCFQAIPTSKNLTRVKCKLWPKKEQEPKAWLLEEELKQVYEGGKCALWGVPYASTPILFDDLYIFSYL